MLSGCLDRASHRVWGILPVLQAGCVLLESPQLKGYSISLSSGCGEEEHTQGPHNSMGSSSPWGTGGAARVLTQYREVGLCQQSPDLDTPSLRPTPAALGLCQAAAPVFGWLYSHLRDLKRIKCMPGNVSSMDAETPPRLWA